LSTLAPVASYYRSHQEQQVGLFQISTERYSCGWASCCRWQQLWTTGLEGAIAKAIRLRLTLTQHHQTLPLHQCPANCSHSVWPLYLAHWRQHDQRCDTMQP